MKNGYIVANKEQELEVLKEFEQKGFKWGIGDLPTEFIFSEGLLFNGFPYIISTYDNDDYIIWSYYSEYYNGKIVYDGRKEEKMSKKYLVTQEFMDQLVEWRDENDLDFTSSADNLFLAGYEIQKLPAIVDVWRTNADSSMENNNRLISILQWLSGEDVFETQKTYKYYVARDSYPIAYLSMKKMYHSEFPTYDSNFSDKKIFDTREEAEKWLVPGYEVEEIDEKEL